MYGTGSAFNNITILKPQGRAWGEGWEGGGLTDRPLSTAIVNCQSQTGEPRSKKSSLGHGRSTEQGVQLHLVPLSQVWDTFSCCKMKQWSQSSNVLASPSQVQGTPVPRVLHPAHHDLHSQMR